MSLVVKSKNMSEQRATECNEIMLRGNSTYRKYSEYIPLQYNKICRRAIIKGNLNEVLRYIPIERKVEFVGDVQIILNVENVIVDIMSQYTRMVKKIASQLNQDNRKGKNSAMISYLSEDDMISKGFIALLDAIHNYNMVEFKFLTYAWNVCHRRILAAIGDSSQMSNFTKKERSVYQRANKLAGGRSLKEMLKEGLITEEESMTISEVINIRVTHSSMIEGEEGSNDYTCFRAVDEEKREWELDEIIAQAHLSVLERDVFISSGSPFFGWRTACAKRHNHPMTGDPISKMAITYALERAMMKMRSVVERKTE